MFTSTQESRAIPASVSISGMMFTYTATGPVLDPLLRLLDMNGIDYTPVWPNNEPIMGFFRTKLAPAEMLLYLETAKGSAATMIPLTENTVKTGRIRHTIRSRSADLGYLT